MSVGILTNMHVDILPNTYRHAYIFPSSETGLGTTSSLFSPDFSSWSFVTGTRVYPRADISTSSHQVSRVVSPITLLYQMVQMAQHVDSDSLQENKLPDG